MRPAVQAFGVGGERLRGVGMECVADTSELAHMGLVEVLRELPRLRRILERVVGEARTRRPPLAILVDSPDFNLRLAARLVRLGIAVVLYVSPQLWAWRQGRVKTVRKLAREVLCLLPFEVGFYRRHGVPARYVGHPLVDDVAREGLLHASRPRTQGRLALLPGSRGMEVRQLLPAMLGALQQLPDRVVSEAVLIEAPGMAGVVDEVCRMHGWDDRLQRITGAGRRPELVAAELAWAASGTATLECALLDVPMIVGYRLRGLSFALAKLLVRVPHVALVNLIAGRRLAPELLQDEWCSGALAAMTEAMFGGPLDDQRRGLAEVRVRLGEPGASRRAAEAVAEYLGPEAH